MKVAKMTLKRLKKCKYSSVSGSSSEWDRLINYSIGQLVYSFIWLPAEWKCSSVMNHLRSLGQMFCTSTQIGPFSSIWTSWHHLLSSSSYFPLRSTNQHLTQHKTRPDSWRSSNKRAFQPLRLWISRWPFQTLRDREPVPYCACPFQTRAKGQTSFCWTYVWEGKSSSSI